MTTNIWVEAETGTWNHKPKAGQTGPIKQWRLHWETLENPGLKFLGMVLYRQEDKLILV